MTPQNKTIHQNLNITDVAPIEDIIYVANKSPPLVNRTVKLHGKEIQFSFLTHDITEDVFLSADFQRKENYVDGGVWGVWKPNFQKKNVIDIGANIGLFTVPLAHFLKKEGIVISIEVDKQNFAVLSANVLYNQLTNVKLFNRALVRDVKKTQCVGNVVPHLVNKGSSHVEESLCSVQTMSLDTMYDVWKVDMCNVGVIKLDVEGYEGRVLMGGKKYLKECPPCKIQIELDPKYLERFGTPVQAVLEYMEELDYKINDREGALDHYGDYYFTHRFATC